MANNGQSAGTGDGQALRLTFTYQGTSVQLASKQSVDMMAPPSDPISDFTGQAGFWYELRDSSSNPLYRRVMQNPIQFDMEAPADDPNNDSGLQRVAVQNPSGMFTLVVPRLDQAQTLALVSSPLDPESLADQATDLATFDLSDGGTGGIV
jgi:hypothetical protein